MDDLKINLSRTEGTTDLPDPAYQSTGASGVDLLAAVSETLILQPGEQALIPTGIKLEIPCGYEGQVRPRSGLAVKHGMTVLNAPGTIDSDYRGEIKVPLINLGSQTVSIERGMRIAQLVFAPITRVSFSRVEVLNRTVRNDKGFGHTGV